MEISDTYDPYVQGLNVDGFVKWENYGSMPEGDWEEYNSTNMMGTVSTAPYIQFLYY